MGKGGLVQLTAKDGGWVSIDPSSVRAVVAAEGGGSLIWFGRGHEAVVKDEPDVVSRKLGIGSTTN
jgi:hypothetical protein